jgi:methyl-accepting chemotaxis protein
VVEVMKTGYANVEQGVNLSYQAGSALEKIQKSVEQSSAMTGRIRKVTEEQVANTRKATQAIEVISELIKQIATSTAEQTKGSDQIIQATGRIKEITPSVKAKARVQTDASRQVHRAMDNISQMVKSIHNSQKAQAQASERIVEAINRIKNITLGNVTSVTNLDRNIAILNQQSEILKAVVALFKLEGAGGDETRAQLEEL